MSTIPKEFRGQQRRRKDTPTDASSQPLFLKKTYNMISNCPYDIAGWSEDGTSVVVRDANRLAAEIIPTVYKHNKFSSFVRQLNFYGFRKLRFESRANYWEFKHPLFRRGDIASISLIKKSAHFQDENTTATTAVKEVKEEVGDVKIQLSDLNKRMSDLDKMIVSLSKILIQNSNLSTQSSLSSSSLPALTNTHTNNFNTNPNSLIIQNSQQHQSVVIKDEYSGPSDNKKRKTKSSDQRQSSSYQYNEQQEQVQQQQQQQEPYHQEPIIPFQQQINSSSTSINHHHNHQNETIPLATMIPLSRCVSMQSTQSSSPFSLHRNVSMNGCNDINYVQESGAGMRVTAATTTNNINNNNNNNNNSSNEEDFNFEYLFALEEKELLLLKNHGHQLMRKEHNHSMTNSSSSSSSSNNNKNNYGMTNSSSSGNNNNNNNNSNNNNHSINLVNSSHSTNITHSPTPISIHSSSSETMNTGRSYSTDVTDMEGISNYMMSANNSSQNISAPRVSLPMTTVVNENAVELSLHTIKNEKKVEMTKNTGDTDIASSLSKLSTVVEDVDMTDISAIIAILPRHLQDRFIDQLAASMQLKVHENNPLLSSSSSSLLLEQLPPPQQKQVSTASIHSTDTVPSLCDNNNEKTPYRTSFQVIPHHDHNDLTFTYHCPVTATTSPNTTTSPTTTTTTNAAAAANTNANVGNSTSNASVDNTEIELNEEAHLAEIHSKLTSQLCIAAASVAAACSPDTDTGATIMSMTDEKSVSSFASMIMKYVYSQDIDTTTTTAAATTTVTANFKTLQDQQQQRKMGYVH